MMKNAFAYTFKGARVSATEGSDLQHKEYVGIVSTIMGMLTSRVGNLLSCFDKNNENDIN